MKRAFDLVSSLLGLALLWPVLVVAIIAVRHTSRGPAIFRQKRVGKAGKLFTLYKLRTMNVGTANKPSHQVGNTSMTPIGDRLRRWKLDELPQLVNVVIGNMSLVGPRPCLPTQTELIEARRSSGALDILPGITGLAQVGGIDMSDPQLLAEIDGVYARTRTFAGDLKLILRTLTGSGLGLDAARFSPPPG